MLDLAIQHLGALKASMVAAGLLGLALMGLALVLRRRIARTSVRLFAIGAMLTSVFTGSTDYRFRLEDIVRAREFLKIAQESDNAQFLTHASHKLAEATAAIGDFSAFGLIFGLGFIAALAIAIRPEWAAKGGARSEVAA